MTSKAGDSGKTNNAGGTLGNRLTVTPRILHPDRAELFLNDLYEKADASETASGLRAFLGDNGNVGACVTGILSNSPYLRELMLADADRLFSILYDNPEDRLARLIREAHAARAESEADLMRDLRLMKQDLALTLGIGDIGGVITLDVVTSALAGFADAAVEACIRFCLGDLTARGKFAPVDPDEPTRDSGFIVLAMGKHGANELNYSSDIDLIVLYDPAKAPLSGNAEAPVEFVRMTRRLVKMMQDRTAEGYIFRTDLRLRPDPGATPLAMSVPAALSYYESLGQKDRKSVV